MSGRLWSLAADVTDLPATVPAGDRTAAILLGIAAIIGAIGGPLVAYVVGRRKVNEDELPKLRRELRRVLRRDGIRQQNEEILQHNLLVLHSHLFDLEQRLAAKGEQVPTRPKLRALAYTPSDEEIDDTEDPRVS